MFTVPSISAIGRSAISLVGNSFLAMKTESKKQLEEPESTRPLKADRTRGDWRVIYNNLGLVVIIVPRSRVGSPVSFKQSVLWKLWILQSYSWKTRHGSTISGTLKQEESILIFLQILTNSLIYPSVVQFLDVTFLVTDSNRLLTRSLFFFISQTSLYFLITHSDTNL